MPYAEALAKLIQPKSVRLRRDFTQLLMGIKAHVLIHREHRFEKDAGELCANMDDYAAVRELMSDIMAETSETKIKATVLETVDAVRTLQAMAGSEGVTAKAVGKRLRLDTSSAFRRSRRHGRRPHQEPGDTQISAGIVPNHGCRPGHAGVVTDQTGAFGRLVRRCQKCRSSTSLKSMQSCNRAIVQSCNRAIVQSCNRAIVQSCNRAIVQSCNRAIVQS